MYHPSATLCDSFGKQGRCCSIDETCPFAITLRLVDSGIGGTVDHTVDMIIMYKSLNSNLIGDVQLVYIRIEKRIFGHSSL